MSFDLMYEQGIAAQQQRGLAPTGGMRVIRSEDEPPIFEPSSDGDLSHGERSGNSTPLDPAQVIYQQRFQDPTSTSATNRSRRRPTLSQDSRASAPSTPPAANLSSEEEGNQGEGGEDTSSQPLQSPVEILQEFTGLSEEVLLRPMFLPAHENDWRSTLKTLLDVLQPSILSSGFISEEDQVNFTTRTKQVDCASRIESTMQTMDVKVKEVMRRFYQSEVAALKILRQTQWNVDSVADIIKLNKNFAVVEHPQLRSVLFSFLTPEDTLLMRASNSHIKRSIEDYVSEQCVEFTAYMMTEVRYVPPQKVVPKRGIAKKGIAKQEATAISPATVADIPSIPHPVSGSPLPPAQALSSVLSEELPVRPSARVRGGITLGPVGITDTKSSSRADLGDGKEATVSYSDGIKFMSTMTKLSFHRRQEFVKEILSRLGILHDEEETTTSGGAEGDEDFVRVGGSLLDLPLLDREGNVFDELLHEEYFVPSTSDHRLEEEENHKHHRSNDSRSRVEEDIIRSAVASMRCIILQFDIPLDAVKLRDVITPCFRLDQLLVIGQPRDGSDMVLVEADQPQHHHRVMGLGGGTATTRSRRPVAGRPSRRFSPNEELISDINHAVLYLSNCYVKDFPRKVVSDGFFPHSLVVRELPGKRESHCVTSSRIWRPINHITSLAHGRGGGNEATLAFLDMTGLKGMKHLIGPGVKTSAQLSRDRLVDHGHSPSSRSNLVDLRLPASQIQTITNGLTLTEVLFKSFSLKNWSNLKSISIGFLSGHRSLVKLDLSASELDTLPSAVASECPSLSSISLEGALKLESIGNDFASNCASLISVTFPGKGSVLKSVGDNFIRYCPLLRQLKNMEHQKELWSVGRGFCVSLDKRSSSTPSSRHPSPMGEGEPQQHFHPRSTPSSMGRLRKIDFSHCDPQVLSRFDILTPLENQRVEVIATEEQLKNKAATTTEGKDLKKIAIRYTKGGVVQRPGGNTAKRGSSTRSGEVPQWKKDREAFMKRKAEEGDSSVRVPLSAPMRVARSPTRGHPSGH